AAGQPAPATPSQPVTVVDQPPLGEVRGDVVTEESDAENRTTGRAGATEAGRDTGDDPMIGGGSRT
ncbi:hypothetical protein A7K94_0216510, partial [Modestobacter sp. VKM Ac-2676]